MPVRTGRHKTKGNPQRYELQIAKLVENGRRSSTIFSQPAIITSIISLRFCFQVRIERKARLEHRLDRTDTASGMPSGNHRSSGHPGSTGLSPVDSGPAEATIEAPSDTSLSCAGPACKVHLVEGSGTELSGETENLLRSRLRSAALLLFAGFAAFLVWHITRLSFATVEMFVLFVLHCLTTVVLGLIALSLCSRCQMTTKQLRWVELITFGLPVVFSVLLQHSKALLWADWHGVIPPVSGVWLLQIFLYALFIPNTWKRAAVVIGLMAAMPLVGMISQRVARSRNGSGARRPIRSSSSRLCWF